MTALSTAFDIETGGVISLVGAGGKTSLMFGLAHELARRGARVLTTTTTKIARPAVDQSAQVIVSSSVAAILRHARRWGGHGGHLTAAAAEDPGERRKLTGLSPEQVGELWLAAVFDYILVEADGAARRPLKAPAAHEPVIPGSSTLVVGVAGLTAIGRPLNAENVFRPERYARLTGLAPEAPVTPRSVALAFLATDGICKGRPPGCRQAVFLNRADTPQRLDAGRDIARRLTATASGALIDTVILGQALAAPPVIEIYRRSA